MLRSINKLTGMSVYTREGQIGTIQEFFFDDRLWGIRYLVVHTNHWLERKDVLISPIAISEIESEDHIHLSLSSQQVEESPTLDMSASISREKEMEFFNYYRWPYYWTGAGLWGIAPAPTGQSETPYSFELPARTDESHRSHHLWSTHLLQGFHLETADHQSYGQIRDFTFDSKTWKIEKIEVHIRHGLLGGKSKRMFLPIEWLTVIHPESKKVEVALHSSVIEGAPDTENLEDLRNYYQAHRKIA